MRVRGFYVLLLIFLTLFPACPVIGNSGEDDPFGFEEGYRQFQRVVDGERNFDIYWLGRGFTAGGLEFRGPGVNEYDEVEGGGAVLAYIAPSALHNSFSLRITLYSRGAWENVQATRATWGPPLYETREARIAGRPAILATTYDTAMPTDERGSAGARQIAIDYGETVVEASTWSIIPLTPTAAEPNPLMDEATLLAVVEQLRPYPE